jgi:hypothetical protein
MDEKRERVVHDPPSANETVARSALRWTLALFPGRVARWAVRSHSLRRVASRSVTAVLDVRAGYLPARCVSACAGTPQTSVSGGLLG